MPKFQQWERANEKLVFCVLRLLKTKEYESEVVQKVTYSLKNIFMEIEKFCLLTLLFGVVHKLSNFFIVLLSIVPIRIFMGGSHRKSYLGCFLQSTIMFGGMVWISDVVKIIHISKWIIFGVLLLEVWISTPIQSPNRMRYSKGKRMEFKAKALSVLLLFCMIQESIPEQYSNQMEVALIIYSLEVFVSFVQIKVKGGCVA